MTITTPTQRAEYAEEMAALWQATAKAACSKNDELFEALQDWKLATRMLADRAMLQSLKAMSEEQREKSLSMLGASQSWEIVSKFFK